MALGKDIYRVWSDASIPFSPSVARGSLIVYLRDLTRIGDFYLNMYEWAIKIRLKYTAKYSHIKINLLSRQLCWIIFLLVYERNIHCLVFFIYANMPDQ